MNTSNYKKVVNASFSVKTVKAGTRNVLAHKQSVPVFAAILGVRTEMGGLMTAVSRFILGHQINDTMRADCLSAIGRVLFYTVVGAKALKVKVPSGTKKAKAKLTKTELVLVVDNISNQLLAHLDTALDGIGLGSPQKLVEKEGAELEAAQAKVAGTDKLAKILKKVDSEDRTKAVEAITALWGDLILHLWQLCWAITGQAPADAMDSNYNTLYNANPTLADLLKPETAEGTEPETAAPDTAVTP